MESNFQERNEDRQEEFEQSQNDPQYTRFELLSAYLDGEVTLAERKQVQQWLDSDPQVQKLYTRLLRLRQDFDHLPIPAATPSTTQLSEQVFQSIDAQKRSRKRVFFGGAAIAAVVIGAFSSLFLGHNLPIYQFAERDLLTPIEEDSEPLAIALNRPIVKIPAAALLPNESSDRN
jgi:ferric-dicitrate binding protein FerR (iron transport regulator)